MGVASQGSITQREAVVLIDSAVSSFGSGWKSSASRTLPLSVVDLSRSVTFAGERPKEVSENAAIGARQPSPTPQPKIFVYQLPKNALEHPNLLRLYIQVTLSGRF